MNTPAAANKARYIMIGGFLGAGKSTSILKLAEHLTAQGLRVGLITNDQGHDLVDTAKARNHGFAVEEIPGGCFCCRFNSLMEAADHLSQETRPDVFIAEPVGSCTDLIASVAYPLRRIYGESFTLAPLSVVLDPHRAASILGIDPKGHFSKKVAYIYLKQLEEASIIVINKADLLCPEAIERLSTALNQRFPQAEVLHCTAREGLGLEPWFAKLQGDEQTTGPAMEVDYVVYGEGEALLGWLNATLSFSSATLCEGQPVLLQLAESIKTYLEARYVEIAHLKMTLAPDDGSGELAVINLVSNAYTPELAQRLSDPLQTGQIIVNLRAEGDPETLHEALLHALESCNQTFDQLHLGLEHNERFRPGQPVPVYRMASESETITLKV